MYSHNPTILGQFNINCDELMFVQYMPVVMHGSDIRLPNNLKCFLPLIQKIAFHRNKWFALDEYVYLTAKHMFVGPQCNANRPGWHQDGFGTSDMNYIWSDSLPTEFCINQHFELSDEHDISLAQMRRQARQENFTTYPEGSLLELDSSVVHRVALTGSDGYRIFAKISISKDRYNLRGNAHNYLFDYDWPMFDRQINRNHPIGK